MKGSLIRSASLLLGAASLVSVGQAALDPIIIKGSKFFEKTSGKQFYIKGVAYQEGMGASGVFTGDGDTKYTDQLADTVTCKRDIPLLKKLGVNAIRTYAIDPEQDHDVCMKLLDEAGIYVISDLSEPDLSINRENPEWNLELFTRYKAVVDSLAKYSNVMGFFAGNEVTNNASYTPASAFVKAAVRDTKAHIKAKGYNIGVGYAADDDAGTRARVAAFFNCGDTAEGIDFWGYNIYSWCDPSTYEESGYKDHVKTFSTYNVPVFFAEYGCNQGSAAGDAPRVFSEVPALYGSDMTKVFSGGIVFQYFNETNDYGLVQEKNGKVTTFKDFDNFSKQIHAVTPSATSIAAYTPTNTAMQECPTVEPEWQVAPTGLPPTPDAEVCKCMVSSLSCVAKPKLSSKELAKAFGVVCGLSDTACAGISYDSAEGIYGAFLGCNSEDKLSHAFNTYYVESGSKEDACDFDGIAQLVENASPAATCESVIASATAAVSTGSGSGSGSDGKKEEDENAGSSMQASSSVGRWAFAAYITAVAVSVTGVVLL